MIFSNVPGDFTRMFMILFYAFKMNLGNGNVKNKAAFFASSQAGMNCLLFIYHFSGPDEHF